VDLQAFNIESKKQSSTNRKFLHRLKQKDSRWVDGIFHEAHDDVFENTNCLECANCCKTTSPIFYHNDIDRISKFLKERPGDFISKYLKVDEDNDYVLRNAPCPFLDSQNHCSIYEARPKACREYPHTNRKKMVQIMELTHKNTLVCPAVLDIVERLKKICGI
jgi:uncharacterized protein